MKKKLSFFTCLCFCLFPFAGFAALQDSSAVNFNKIQQIETFDDLPVGTIIPWSTNKSLPGEDKGSKKWLPCDGQLIPGGGKFALLRSIVGATTPKYNSAPNDNRFGVFLRGSKNPRLGVINADTTEEHTHEQKTHSHKFNLEVARNYLRGETLSAKYMDGKRGWIGWSDRASDQADAIRAPWTTNPNISKDFLVQEIQNQPPEWGDILRSPDGWGPKKLIVDTKFEQVKNSRFFAYNGYGSYHDFNSLAYTTSASVKVSGRKSPEGHSVVVRRKWIPGTCSNGSCSDGYYEDIWGTVNCSGSNFTKTQNVSIKNVSADDPDFLIRPHTSTSFLGGAVDTNYSYGAAWSIYGGEGTMEDSALNGVRIINKKVIGHLNEDGGDDSSYGYDNRGRTPDQQETMPANVTVRYIIKALP